MRIPRMISDGKQTTRQRLFLLVSGFSGMSFGENTTWWNMVESY